MGIAKPTTLPAWNTNGTNNVAPTSGRKASGFVTGGDTFASGEGNWLFGGLYSWISFLNDPQGPATTGVAGIDITSGEADGAYGFITRGAAGFNTIGLGVVSPFTGGVFASGGITLAGASALSPGAAIIGYAAGSGVGLYAKSDAYIGVIAIAGGASSGAALFGQATAGGNGVQAFSVSGFAGIFNRNTDESALATAAAGFTVAAYGLGGIYAKGTSAAGVQGQSDSGVGGQFYGNATRSALAISSQSTPSAKFAGDLWFDSALSDLAFYDGVSVRKMTTIFRCDQTLANQSITTTASNQSYSSCTFTIFAQYCLPGARWHGKFRASASSNSPQRFNFNVFGVTLFTVDTLAAGVPLMIDFTITILNATTIRYIYDIAGGQTATTATSCGSGDVTVSPVSGNQSFNLGVTQGASASTSVLVAAFYMDCFN